jgi:putative inorganic carbon (hco3(-)) transporter
MSINTALQERSWIRYAMAVERTLPKWLTHERIRRSLLAVVILSMSLPFGIHLGYREDMSNLGSVGGFNITPGTLALAGLYIPYLIRRRYGASVGTLQLSQASAPLGLYLLFCFLSLFGATDITLGLYEIFLVVQVFLLHFYIVNSGNPLDDVILIIRYLLIGLVLEGLLMIALAGGLADVVGGGTRIEDPSVADVTRQINIFSLRARIDENSATGRSRVGGGLGSPNDAAGYLSAVTGVALSVLLTSANRRFKFLAAVALGLGLIALILTFSRGGWVSFLVIVCIVSFLGLRGKRFSWRMPAAVIACLLPAGLVFSDAIVHRLTADDKGAAHSRVPLMKLATLIIEDHPLFGVGANNFPLAMEPYVTRGFSGEFLYTVHNKYLLVWSETGPGALFALLWFLVDIVRRGMRCWRYRDPLVSPVALGLAAGICGQMIHMLVDIFRGYPAMEFLPVAAAVQVLLERIASARGRAAVGIPGGNNFRHGGRNSTSATRFCHARRVRFV